MATRLQPASRGGFVPREGETVPRRSGGAGTASVLAPPEHGAGLAHSAAEIPSLPVRAQRERRAKTTIESHWYPRGSGAYPPAATLPDQRQDVTRDSASAVDRICAIVTMIVAATLAVAVSIVVAPRLRNVAAANYPEISALVMKGGEIYGAACHGIHGSHLLGDVSC